MSEPMLNKGEINKVRVTPGKEGWDLVRIGVPKQKGWDLVSKGEPKLQEGWDLVSKGEPKLQ